MLSFPNRLKPAYGYSYELVDTNIFDSDEEFEDFQSVAANYDPHDGTEVHSIPLDNRSTDVYITDAFVSQFIFDKLHTADEARMQSTSVDVRRSEPDTSTDGELTIEVQPLDSGTSDDDMALMADDTEDCFRFWENDQSKDPEIMNRRNILQHLEL